MSDMFIDLQMHTTCSDGAWPKEKIFEEIRAKNLELFCITDHDTIAAYPVPDDLASRCVPGLEVDTEHAGHTVHLLAYGVTDDRSALLTAETELIAVTAPAKIGESSAQIIAPGASPRSARGHADRASIRL